MNLSSIIFHSSSIAFDFFFSITDYETPKQRFIQVVKWYLSAFHAGRKSAVPKKPYNPILGEVFQCHYDLGATSSEDQVKDGPVPWASENEVTFIAEQTSHHPPSKKKEIIFKSNINF